MLDRILKIDSNNVFRIIEEKVEDFNNSVFREQYIQAGNCLSRILDNQNIEKEQKEQKEAEYNVIQQIKSTIVSHII